MLNIEVKASRFSPQLELEKPLFATLFHTYFCARVVLSQNNMTLWDAKPVKAVNCLQSVSSDWYVEQIAFISAPVLAVSWEQ